MAQKEKTYSAEIELLTPRSVTLKVSSKPKQTWVVARTTFDSQYTDQYLDGNKVELEVYAEDLGDIVDYNYRDIRNLRQHLTMLSKS